MTLQRKNSATTAQNTVLFSNGIASVSFNLSPNLMQNKAALLKTAQAVVDSSVLSYCAIYAPRKTGAMIASSFSGTQIGSGKIVYTSNYAGYQYYGTQPHRTYDANRGSRWFERMKINHKHVILQNAASAAGARAVIR